MQHLEMSGPQRLFLGQLNWSASFLKGCLSWPGFGIFVQVICLKSIAFSLAAICFLGVTDPEIDL